MRVGVTGHSGFLGSELTIELLSRGYHVFGLDQRKLNINHPNLVERLGSILSNEDLTWIINNSNVVIHLAAVSDIKECFSNWWLAFEVNTRATLNLARIILESNNKPRLIYASSIYRFNNYSGIYGASKLSSEEYLKSLSKDFDLKLNIIYYGSLYGVGCSEQNRIYRMASELLSKGKISDVDKEVVRKYIHISDAVHQTLMVLSDMHDVESAIITGDENISSEYLADLLIEINGEGIKAESGINYSENNRYKLSPYRVNKSLPVKVSTSKVELEYGLYELIKFLK